MSNDYTSTDGQLIRKQADHSTNLEVSCPLATPDPLFRRMQLPQMAEPRNQSFTLDDDQKTTSGYFASPFIQPRSSPQHSFSLTSYECQQLPRNLEYKHGSIAWPTINAQSPQITNWDPGYSTTTLNMARNSEVSLNG